MVLLGVLLVTPILIVGINGLVRSWFPAGDWAMTELRVVDVGGPHTPLVGPYSRFGWNHPGPLLFWILAIPYRLTGGRPGSLLAGAALINAGAVAGMVTLAWRRGRLMLALPLAVALAVVLHALGPELLRNPWNPWVTVLPFGLLVVAAWAASEGDVAGLFLVPLVGAFEVQSHVAFAPMVAALTAAAFVCFYLRTRRTKPMLWAAAIVAACWSPVVLDLLTGGSNVSDLVSFFGSSRGNAGLGTAVETVARQLGLRGPWTGSFEPIIADGSVAGRSVTALVIPILAMAGSGALAWRAGERQAVRLQMFVAGTVLVGLFSVSRIDGSLYDYLLRWWWPLAALWWVSVAYTVGCVVRHARPSQVGSRWAVGVASVVAAASIALLVVPVAADAGAPLPIDDWGPALGATVPGLEAALPHDRPVLLTSAGPIAGWAYDGLAARLASSGFDVRVADEGINTYKFGEFRLADPSEPSTTVVVATGGNVAAQRAVGAVEVSSYDPLSPDERADADALEALIRNAAVMDGRRDVITQLDRWERVVGDPPLTGITPEMLDRFEAYRRRGVRLSMFLEAPA